MCPVANDLGGFGLHSQGVDDVLAETFMNHHYAIRGAQNQGFDFAHESSELRASCPRLDNAETIEVLDPQSNGGPTWTQPYANEGESR
jgi:hypothetical protein